MGNQRDMFLASEADAFFARNQVDDSGLADRVRDDLVVAALRSRALEPRRVLELGASDGWRLDALRRPGHDFIAAGLDPSRGALAAGARRFPDLHLVCGTAERLPFASRSFDLVILGFFLYVVDRDDLFRVAGEVDRVVAEHGTLAILDFHCDVPVRRPYRDAAGCYSYKMDYGAMFDWNPAYSRTHETFSTHPGGRKGAPEDRIVVTLLERDPHKAYMEGQEMEGHADPDGVHGVVASKGVA